MSDNYDSDWICFDESTEFPPLFDIEQLEDLAAKLGETLSALRDYLCSFFSAFAETIDALAEELRKIAEGLPLKKQKLRKPVKKVSFVRRLQRHGELIPYYTGGFL